VAVLADQLACDLVDQALGSRSDVVLGQQPRQHELLSNGSLLALARNAGSAIAAEVAVLGCSRVVAVQVGGREVLEDVQF